MNEVPITNLIEDEWYLIYNHPENAKREMLICKCDALSNGRGYFGKSITFLSAYNHYWLDDGLIQDPISAIIDINMKCVIFKLTDVEMVNHVVLESI